MLTANCQKTQSKVCPSDAGLIAQRCEDGERLFVTYQRPVVMTLPHREDAQRVERPTACERVRCDLCSSRQGFLQPAPSLSDPPTLPPERGKRRREVEGLFNAPPLHEPAQSSAHVLDL